MMMTDVETLAFPEFSHECACSVVGRILLRDDEDAYCCVNPIISRTSHEYACFVVG